MKLVFFIFLIILISSAKADTALIGQVSSLSCKSKIATLWISEEISNSLLYQTDVPDKSSFKVYLIPGKYKIVLNNEEGCFVEESIEISKKNNIIKKSFVLKAK